MMKTTNAMIKFINSSRKTFPSQYYGPNATVAVSQAPPGTKGVKIGMTILSTSDFIRAQDAIPIMKAIASGITLYS